MGDVPSIEGDRVGGVKKNSVWEILKGSFPLYTHQDIHKGISGYLGGRLSWFGPLMGSRGWQMGDMPSKEGDRMGGVKKNSLWAILKRLISLSTHWNIHKGKSGYLTDTLGWLGLFMGAPEVTDGWCEISDTSIHFLGKSCVKGFLFADSNSFTKYNYITLHVPSREDDRAGEVKKT